MAELIISISGMRGIIGENLMPDVAAKYGAAFGTFLNRSNTRKLAERLKVCVGRDSRPSGQMIASAVTAGLTSCGIDVVDLGIVTTPCVGVMLRHLKCAGGVVITASHNPTPYNGIKLLLDNGIAPPKPLAEKIREIYFQDDLEYCDSVNCGTVEHNTETDAIHIEKTLATVDVELIKKQNYKVVLDSVNGAGGRIGKKLLEALGCEVVGMNIEQTGLFAHTPEPTKENLTSLCQGVTVEKADIGFAQDPDADRLAIVAQDGEYIGEEYSLAFAAENVMSENKGKKAAANLSTSRMIDDVAKKYGGTVLRTPVGEANVAQAMIENDCIIGGEGNGGIIDLRVGPVRDSLVAMALTLELMAKRGKSVTQLVGEIGGYFMYKTKVAADKTQAAKVIEKAKRLFNEAKVDESDGCRMDFADGWIHIRTSNTEPVMRIIAECIDEKAAMKYVDAVSEILEKL